MRNNYRPNRAFVALCANGDHLKMGKEHFKFFLQSLHVCNSRSIKDILMLFYILGLNKL